MNLRRSFSALALFASVAAIAACGGAPEEAAAPVAAPPPPSVAAIDDAAPTVRLPTDARPTRQAIELKVDPKLDRYSGSVEIALALAKPRAVLWLHGRDLNVTRAVAVVEGGAEIVGTWKQEDKTGLASIRFASPLPAGKATLRVAFDAAFGPRLEGFYKVKRGGAAYVFTQFEAIAARTAFPCFDEPSFKIPFEVALTVPAGDVAISNTHEVSRKADGGSVQVHFAPTLPLPSYLIAFAVGPLDVVKVADIPANAVRARPIPLRGVAMKGGGKEMTYALAHTGEFITLLEKYFGVAYPYDKLDILSVGDKGGAMENAGAVTFDDYLLQFDPAKAPIRQRKAYAEVMAHELAHQWFGDLVTTDFWNDIWLNEAFATWISAKIVDQWDPKLEARVGLLGGVQGAMGNDALASARAIRQPILSTDDIENAFDSITYRKGGGVIAMFERWATPEAFQKGVHAYLEAHKFGNATADDLLDAASRAAGKDMKAPFRTFLDQPGVPFVEAETRCDGAPRLHLKQSRYFPAGSTGDANRTWQIPVCARFSAKGESKEACTLLTQKEGDLPLGPADGACPDWVLPNADAAGYFRFSLAPADLAKLRAKGIASLTAREKTAYGNSLRAAFNRGALPMTELFPAAAVLATDPRREIAGEPLGMIDEARAWFYDDKLRGAVERYTGSLYKATTTKLGWKPAPGEAGDRTELRGALLHAMAETARDAGVRAEAKKLGLAYLGYKKDGLIHAEAVDPNVAAVALGVVGEDADRALWDATKAQLAKTEEKVTRARLIHVLTEARKPELIPLVRELTFNPMLRPTEATRPVWALLGHHETRAATWEWVKANFDRLLTVVPKHHGQTQLIQMASVFCDDAHAADAQAFFTKARIEGMPGAPRVLAGALEDIRLCAARRKKQEASARAFFSKK